MALTLHPQGGLEGLERPFWNPAGVPKGNLGMNIGWKYMFSPVEYSNNREFGMFSLYVFPTYTINKNLLQDS